MTPLDFSGGSNEKVWWRCKDNPQHEWDSTIAHRNGNNRGCPFCAGQKVALDNCLATTHLNIAALWHPIKNGDVTPFDVVLGSTAKRWWRCSKNKQHEWQKTPRSLTRMTTDDYCPQCRQKWTIETLVIEARKYQTRNAFRKGSSAAYQAAHGRSSLDRICSHMEPSKTGKKWFKETVAEEAKKYPSRVMFEKGSSGAYDAALKNGWMDDVCEHMIKLR